LYAQRYFETYKNPPSMNRYQQKWGFQDMLDDLGYDDARAVIDYYFELKIPGHPVLTLFKRYDEMHRFQEEEAADRELRLALREKTRLRVQKYEEEHGNG
jgi:hypothetical protein